MKTCKLTSSVKRKSLAAACPSLELCVTLGLRRARQRVAAAARASDGGVRWREDEGTVLGSARNHAARRA